MTIAGDVTRPNFQSAEMKNPMRETRPTNPMSTFQTVFATTIFAFALINLPSVNGQDETRSILKSSSKPGFSAENYHDAANKIIEASRKSNNAYLMLQELCDDIGHRLSGSPSLDRAIEWANKTLKKQGHENVQSEKVMVRKWVRGNETAQLTFPRQMDIPMLGLGGSVGTGNRPIAGEVIVVDSKQELDELADAAIQGRIVVFNHTMPPYSETDGSGYGAAVQYRMNGATWAAERGGIAALVRSVTAYSLQSPHTGAMRYSGGADVPKVPTAAISVESATMLRRLQDRGVLPRVSLYMQARDEGEVPSANVVAEIVGSEKPEEIVAIGGHIDSWDVGQGAQDDGCGCVVAMEALNVIRKLGLKPKRTIRVVLWTNEENGLAGGRSYAARHQDEVHVAAIESDSGGFRPQGLSIDMEDDKKEQIAVVQLGKVLSLLEKVGSTRATTGYSGADVNPLKPSGTACMGLRVDGRLYFNTHHTAADTVDKVDPKELADCVATVAVASFVIADMPSRLGDE